MSERRFLIVHGVENRRPPEHWQHWLAEELRRRREVVLYPQLPEPDRPNLEAWVELLRAELAQLGKGERVVLCHSLGVLAWLHLVDRLAAHERVHRVLLVSPPSPDILWPEVASFSAPNSLSAEWLRAASGDTRIVCGDPDPYCPEGAPALYGEPFDVPVDEIAGGGHLGSADGYGPWPAVLAWCLDGTVPLTSSSSTNMTTCAPALPGRMLGAVERG